MTTQPRTASPRFLVTGAAGNVGRAVLTELIARGYRARGLYRSARESMVGVEPVIGDLNEPASLERAFDDVAAVFLLPGYADMPGLVRLAERAGARIVLLSSIEAATQDAGNAVVAYMLDSETAVRAAEVPWCILRPSGFMTNTFRWTPQLRDGDVVRLPFPDQPVALIDPTDIATVAVRALTSGDHDGTTLHLSGPETLRPADQVAAVGMELGRPLVFEVEPDYRARARMLAEMPPAYVDAFFAFAKNPNSPQAEIVPTVEQITNHPARTFAQWCRREHTALRSRRKTTPLNRADRRSLRPVDHQPSGHDQRRS